LISGRALAPPQKTEKPAVEESEYLTRVAKQISEELIKHEAVTLGG